MLSPKDPSLPLQALQAPGKPRPLDLVAKALSIAEGEEFEAGSAGGVLFIA